VRNVGRGTTLLELLVVLGLFGILSSLGALSLRPPPARLAANAVQAVVQQARFDAIRANRPMVVAIDGGTQSVRVSSSTDAATVACGSATLIRTVPFAEGIRVTVDASAFPIVWLPSGQPRSCDGTPIPLAGVSLGVSDGYRSLTVNVGAGGEVAVR
jgi:prepilin-type N-terminal cleavage/methylation domain-containing protein